MAVTSWPFDSQDTNESQYTLLFRELQDTGVSDTQYGSTSWQVTANTGMTLNVASGFAIVRGHAVQNTSTATLTVSTAHSTQVRYDRVVLRLNPGETVGSALANSITPMIVAGTPGAGQPPSLEATNTGLYDLSLAIVQVDAGVGTITSGKITDTRTFLGANTRRWTTATRPSATTVRPFTLGYNTTTGKWEYSTGSAWTDLLPAAVDNATKWNGYSLTVSPTTPAGTPTSDRIWIQPTS